MALSELIEKGRKFFRFVGIYGLSRTLVKSFGRQRSFVSPFSFYRKREPDTLLIGCGQFAFSTICYFLRKNRGIRFLSAFDINREASASLGKFFRFKTLSTTPEGIFDRSSAGNYLYIASNHASHADYAIKGLERDLQVYVEKPIAVTYTQLVGLLHASNNSKGNLFAGYNRPYSSAIKDLKNKLINSGILKGRNHPFNISFFINGHVIPSDHWYRKPEEGTRICGNVGHWIDLTIHLLNWRSIPSILEITIVYANPEEFDDNITIAIRSNLNDLVTITLVSQSEPFEGISESINLQYGSMIARIDDFRQMSLWIKEKKFQFRYFPKDVGHQRAIMQPFFPKNQNRDFNEVILSSYIMLEIMEMVRNRENFRLIDIQERISKLQLKID